MWVLNEEQLALYCDKITYNSSIRSSLTSYFPLLKIKGKNKQQLQDDSPAYKNIKRELILATNWTIIRFIKALMRKRDEEKGKYNFIHKHTCIVNSIIKVIL